jgi:hypothetical protein
MAVPEEEVVPAMGAEIGMDQRLPAPALTPGLGRLMHPPDRLAISGEERIVGAQGGEIAAHAECLRIRLPAELHDVGQSDRAAGNAQEFPSIHFTHLGKAYLLFENYGASVEVFAAISSWMPGAVRLMSLSISSI